MALVVLAVIFVLFPYVIASNLNRSLALESNVTSCAGFFDPCRCSTDFNGKNSVTCQDIFPEDAHAAFHKPDINSTDIYTFTYIVRNMSKLDLPYDLLGGHKVTGILTIRWWAANQETTLTVAPDAFKSSTEYLRSLDIQGFNAKNMNWDFLNKFSNMSTLTMIDMSGMDTLSHFPKLTSPLKSVTVQNCRGLTNLPQMPPNLTRLDIPQNGFNDRTVSKILQDIWNANETLTQLDLSNQPLTSIPKELKMFSNLQFVTLKWTNITSLPVGSFFSPFYFQSLNLELSNVTYIEPQAFQGYYGGVLVNMKRNLFDRFKEAVFRNVLVDMYCANSGQLDIEYSSNVTCDCSIAWLIRDSRHLLRYIWRGQCSNSTLFTKLDPAGFANCEPTTNVTICQDVPTTTPRPTTPSTITTTSSTISPSTSTVAATTDFLSSDATTSEIATTTTLITTSSITSSSKSTTALKIDTTQAQQSATTDCASCYSKASTITYKFFIVHFFASYLV